MMKIRKIVVLPITLVCLTGCFSSVAEVQSTVSSYTLEESEENIQKSKENTQEKIKDVDILETSLQATESLYSGIMGEVSEGGQCLELVHVENHAPIYDLSFKKKDINNNSYIDFVLDLDKDEGHDIESKGDSFGCMSTVEDGLLKMRIWSLSKEGIDFSVDDLVFQYAFPEDEIKEIELQQRMQYKKGSFNLDRVIVYPESVVCVLNDIQDKEGYKPNIFLWMDEQEDRIHAPYTLREEGKLILFYPLDGKVDMEKLKGLQVGDIHDGYEYLDIQFNNM